MMLEDQAVKNTHEFPIFDLLEVMVPMDEIAALSRTQNHLLLEKSSLANT